MITYKGLPAPIICDYLSREKAKELYADHAEFQIGKIEMVSNTGTYIDCPFHRYAHGKDLSEVGLESFVNLRAKVLRFHHSQYLSLNADMICDFSIDNYDAILFHTDWSDHWTTDVYFNNHPFLTADAADYIKSCGIKLVGIDSHNIDDTRSNHRPVHSILLGAEILIVEHLCNLRSLPDSDFKFNAVPPKIKGVGTFPVRAFATV